MEFKFKATDIAKHSAAHVLAAAVKRIFPTVKVGLGPVTKSGFYYDFEVERPLENSDLELIEQNINQIIEEDLSFQQVTMEKQAGLDMLLQIGQIYKAEVIRSLSDEQVSFYKLGEEFIDLCRGPHVRSTSEIGVIKLVSIEETYWNNDQSRPKMYRVHGVVFQNIAEYNEYIESIRLQENRDVIKLSNQFGYTSKLEDRNIFTTKGSQIVHSISNLIVDRLSDGNQFEVVLSEGIDPWVVIQKSYFHENVSYKTLPVTLIGAQENSNEDKNISAPVIMAGIFVPLGKEIVYSGDLAEKVINISNYIAKKDIHINIKCKDLDDKFVKTLSSLFQKRIISHNKVLTSQVEGTTEIEFSVTDTVGKTWNLCKCIINTKKDSTSEYYTSGNTKEVSSIIKLTFNVLTIYSYLIEEYDRKLPFMFKPVQMICIPKDKEQIDYATEICSHLKNKGYRAEIDTRSRSLDAKIKNAEDRDVEFLFIVGPKEESNNAVAVRRNNTEIGLISTDTLIKFIQENQDRN